MRRDFRSLSQLHTNSTLSDSHIGIPYTFKERVSWLNIFLKMSDIINNSSKNELGKMKIYIGSILLATS